jgi:hypothetical protein
MSTLTIRMPDDTHARLCDLARMRGVSINKLVEEMTIATLSAHDAEVRFRLMAARGNPKRLEATLRRLDAEERQKGFAESKEAFRARPRKAKKVTARKTT